MAAEGAAVAIMVVGVLPAAGHAGGLRGRGLFLNGGLRRLGGGLGLRLMAVIMRSMGHGAGSGPCAGQHQKADEHQASQHWERI